MLLAVESGTRQRCDSREDQGSSRGPRSNEVSGRWRLSETPRTRQGRGTCNSAAQLTLSDFVSLTASWVNVPRQFSVGLCALVVQVSVRESGAEACALRPEPMMAELGPGFPGTQSFIE
jgi:hypothetical protein